MNRYIEELHNKEDVVNLMDSVLAFIGLISILCLVGVLFWAAV